MQDWRGGGKRELGRGLALGRSSPREEKQEEGAWMGRGGEWRSRRFPVDWK